MPGKRKRHSIPHSITPPNLSNSIEYHNDDNKNLVS